jgi:hypothetical protein
MAELRIQLDAANRKEQQYQQYIESMRMEKEEMIRNHTIETADLRKKVSVLTDHVTKLESAQLTAVPQAAYGSNMADFADIDSLTLDGGWDNLSLFNDLPSDGVEPVKQEATASTTSLSLAKKDDDKPAAQSLLLMLLLIGAFVTSKGQGSPGIPRVSEDVRAGATTILQDVFNEAGVSNSAAPIIPMPSGLGVQAVNDWTTVPDHVSLSQLHAFVHPSAPSGLDTAFSALSVPSADQAAEQAFSLTAAQYNAAMSPSFSTRELPSQAGSGSGRKGLLESLAKMREQADREGGKTEVYTRSLLWEQVPRDVVRNFARMVQEVNAEGGDNPDTAMG